MPVLKIKNNGVWEQVSGIPDHTHVIDDITDFPTSLPANGGNADTVDGKHASDFASAAEMTTVQNDINDINTMLNGIEIPTELPNPNALRFTGAVEGTYDGSSPITVEIPQALQPDYNQNDQTAGDYIKNRPFYTDYEYITLFENLTGSADYKHGPMASDIGFSQPYLDFVSLLLPESFLIEKGDNLLVEIDGKKYNVTADSTDYAPKVTYVNGYFPYLWNNTTEESPFHISPYTEFHPDSNSSIESGRYYFTMAFTNEPPKTLSIKKVSENIVKIPNEYLPETTYVDYSKAQELTDEQKSQARTNIGVETLDVSGKMDKNNPTGTGSFSLNRKAGTVVGANSHAEGSGATASGWYSHAEGRDTTASNDCSHAEGDYTTASGKYSHAEGSITTASGNNSHAEGSMTSASGGYSHAEGQDTSASGERSHAEGQGTSASGTGSHTEGYHTKASSSYQHVQGKYNIEDPSDVYADIVGNGTKSKPSNAATVDWSGNAWYAGDVYVGSTSGTNKDEGSKKLATEEYVDNSTASIEIPQSDWNQNDETAPDYVKNRPFYTGDPVETVFVKESTVTFTEQDGMYQAGVPSTFVPTIGETYTVTWDGIDYECTCIESNSTPLLGDINILFGEPNPAGEPFLIGAFNGAELRIITLDTSTSHTISISKTVAALVVKIDEKYLPDTLLSFKPSGKSYLTFSSPSSFTLAVNDSTKHWNGTLEYFASDKTWTVWNGASALSAVADDGEYVLYLRGIGNTVITGNNVNYKWVLDGSHISCIGNIESLLDYATVESGDHPTMAANCYFSMFNGCTSLTQAPALPATTLAASCYSSMFYGCTSLTQAPDLPATKLANYCYQHMFNGCTRLTKAPALPCNRLADKCYQHMFNGCTSLIQAPALPATKLVDNCYAYMFKGCISLTQTLDLPATTLAASCYANMFNGCTRLTKAPALPATKLVANCYTYMFYDCRSLTQAPALPATALAASCYANMFRGCSSLKFSSTQIGEYTQEYRIPSSGEGATATDALTNMFTSTGGTFTGTPSINTTYYLSSDNMIVRETDIATLNGYVGSMIDAAVDIPTTLPNPNALTFTGAAEGTYDGSSALTVEIPSTPEIPTQLPNPQSLTFTGAVNASYNGSSEMSVKIPGALSDLSEDATHRVVTDAEKAKWNAKSNFSGSYNDLTDKPTIPDVPVQSVNGKTGAVVLSAEDVGALPGSTVIPTALPNPNALTFTGAATGSYDGSNSLTVEIPVGAAGKSAYQYAQDGGYAGTETEFAEKLAQEMISGTTNEITPTQVYEAVSAGIPVKVQYRDSTYGLLSFTAFNVAESLDVIVSQTIVYYNGGHILAELFGNKSNNSWGFNATTLAQKTDIPSSLKNPNALTIKIGSTTVTYDGSTAETVEIADGTEVSY